MKTKYSFVLTITVLLLLTPVAVFSRDQDLVQKLRFARIPGSSAGPLFTLRTPEGKSVRLSDLRGRLVLLNFWATWCPPCRLEMPSMEKLHREYKGRGLEVVAMNFMEGLEPIDKFLKENDFSFTVLLDRDAKVAQSYGVHALPVTFLIGREGNLLLRSLGYKDWYSDQTRRFIASLLEDETIINHGPAAEVEAVLWPANSNGTLLVIGIAALGLLVVSALWLRGRRFREE